MAQPVEEEVSLKDAMRAPPLLKPAEAVVLFVGEIFLPGFATVIFGAIADCNTTYMLVGLLQILTIAVFGLGIFWAWVWGGLGLADAFEEKRRAEAEKKQQFGKQEYSEHPPQGAYVPPQPPQLSPQQYNPVQPPNVAPSYSVPTQGTPVSQTSRQPPDNSAPPHEITAQTAAHTPPIPTQPVSPLHAPPPVPVPEAASYPVPSSYPEAAPQANAYPPEPSAPRDPIISPTYVSSQYTQSTPDVGVYPAPPPIPAAPVGYPPPHASISNAPTPNYAAEQTDDYAYRAPPNAYIPRVHAIPRGTHATSPVSGALPTSNFDAAGPSSPSAPEVSSSPWFR